MTRLLAPLAALLVYLQQAWRYCRDPRFFVDDPFISMRFAANLVEHAELSFNPGTRVEGYSNFLHVLVQAAVFRIRGGIPGATDGIAAVTATVFLSAVLTLLALFRLSRVTPRGSTESLAWYYSWILTMASSAFAFWSVSGLETPIECLLYACIALVVVDNRWTQPVHLGTVSLLLCAVTLNRFEGALVAFAMCVALVIGLSPRERLRVLGPLAIQVVAPSGAYHLVRLWYFGSVLPNTYIAKATGGSTLERLNSGLHYCGNWLATLGGGTMVIALLLAFAVFNRSLLQTPRVAHLPMATNSVRLSVALLAAKLLLVMLGGGDWMPGFRMLLPVAPFAAFLAIRLLLCAHELMPDPRDCWRSSLLLAAAIPLVVRGVPVVPSGVETNHTGGVRRLPASYVGMGELLGRSFRNEEVAIGEAGLIPFEARQVRFLDLFGLTDADMAHQSGGMHRRVHEPHLIDRHPAAVVFAHLTTHPPYGPYQYGPELLANRDFHARYRRVVLEDELTLQGWALYVMRGTDPRQTGLPWMDVDPIVDRMGK